MAARRFDSSVQLIEKSKFPRHKVCGEFFSPEIAAELDRLGVWDRFLAAAPARIRGLNLNFGSRVKRSRLSDTAWGLSRYAFDSLLLDAALQIGVELKREPDQTPQVVAVGRNVTATSRGRRLFGFKAHFEGPAGDAVELFFFGRAYVGVNAVENGKTNVCGLAPEDFLRRFDFDFDRVVLESAALADRLKPLRRSINWLSTGPLNFEQNFAPAGAYRAGDALSFIDPFTGTGLVAAVKTGRLAGKAAAQGETVKNYLANCRESLRKPFEIAGILRKAVNSGLAETLSTFVPSRLLFALTRPR